jgi:hypothetical protein
MALLGLIIFVEKVNASGVSVGKIVGLILIAEGIVLVWQLIL